MALIPTTAPIGAEMKTVAQKDWPSNTYRIDWEAGRIAGRIDGADAMRQAIHKIIMTERFRHRIYSWNYGVELESLFGGNRSVLQSELKRVFREALLSDDRILAVSDIEMTWIGKRTMSVSFSCDTVFGKIDAQTEVTLNV